MPTDDLMTWDVFISHASADRRRVGEIASALAEAGLRVWYDAWSIKPGDDIFAAIEQGLQRSKVLLLCMSANAFGSDWVQLERSTAIFRDPTNAGRRFLPVLLSPSDIPDTVRRFAYIDLTTGGKRRVKDVVAACRAAIAGSSASSASTTQLVAGSVKVSWPAPPVSAAVSGDGRFVAWIDETGQIYVYTRRTGTTADVARLAADEKSRLIVTGGNAIVVYAGGELRCLQRNVQKRDWRMPEIDGCAALSSTEATVLVTLRNGDIRTIQADTGTLISTKAARISAGGNDVIWPAESSHYVLRSRNGANVVVVDNDTGDRVPIESALQDYKVTVVGIDQYGRHLLLGCDNSELRFFGMREHRRRVAGKPSAIFEGHSGAIQSVIVSADGKRAFSRSRDQADPGRVWKLPSGELLALVDDAPNPLAFADGEKTLIGTTAKGLVELPLPQIAPKPATSEGLAATQTRYTNAKVVLVGESGVGKSGLARRLVCDAYEQTDSTHATDAWRIAVPVGKESRVEREIWLWDLAGQPDYKLTHQLMLDDTSVALLVVNPQGDDALAGMGEWARMIDAATKQAAVKPAKILVHARIDRGGATVSNEKIRREMDAYKVVRRIDTSAATGLGCSDSADSSGVSALKRAMFEAVPWSETPNIVTDRVIRRVKQIVVDRLGTTVGSLLRFSELYQNVQRSSASEPTDPIDVRKAVRLLANQHLVLPLDFGDLILLKPSVMNSYMAAVTRAARDHVDQIGCVAERDVLEAQVDFSGVERLDQADEQLLLRGLVKRLIERAICFAEDTDTGRQLIFPSLYRRDRPIDPDRRVHLYADFSGELGATFAKLVVRLWLGSGFANKEIWKNAAEFKTAGGDHIVGFFVERKEDGGGRISMFASKEVSPETQVVFQRCVDQHLREMAEDVRWHQRFFCAKCKEPYLDQAAIQHRLKNNKPTATCNYCDAKITLGANMLAQYVRNPQYDRKADESAAKSQLAIDTQAKEQLLIGHMMSIAAEANQIFRPTSMFDYGIDGEIEFKDDRGRASGRKIYVQLKSGDSYLRMRKGDGMLIFDAKAERHIEYWLSQPVDVYLVIRTSDGNINWMNMSSYLRATPPPASRQIVFLPERLDAYTLIRLGKALVSGS